MGALEAAGNTYTEQGVRVALGVLDTLIGRRVEVPIKLGDSRRELRRPAE